MDTFTILKIKENKNLLEYLHNHSYYYQLLNRNKSYYDIFYKNYKKAKNENNINKFNNVIENVELISNIMKIID